MWVETGDDYGGDTMFRVVSPSILPVSVQYSTVQYSTVQYSTVQYSTVHDVQGCVAIHHAGVGAGEVSAGF